VLLLRREAKRGVEERHALGSCFELYVQEAKLGGREYGRGHGHVGARPFVRLGNSLHVVLRVPRNCPRTGLCSGTVCQGTYTPFAYYLFQ